MNKKVEKVACPVCGKKFAKKSVNHKYCSIKCKRAAAKSKTANVKKVRDSKPVAKKPVAKKLTEKIALPKPPVKKPSVVISVNGVDPYKKFALALCVAVREFQNILKNTKPISVKKGK